MYLIEKNKNNTTKQASVVPISTLAQKSSSPAPPPAHTSSCGPKTMFQTAWNLYIFRNFFSNNLLVFEIRANIYHHWISTVKPSPPSPSSREARAAAPATPPAVAPGRHRAMAAAAPGSRRARPTRPSPAPPPRPRPPLPLLPSLRAARGPPLHRRRRCTLAAARRPPLRARLTARGERCRRRRSPERKPLPPPKKMLT